MAGRSPDLLGAAPAPELSKKAGSWLILHDSRFECWLEERFRARIVLIQAGKRVRGWAGRQNSVADGDAIQIPGRAQRASSFVEGSEPPQICKAFHPVCNSCRKLVSEPEESERPTQR